MDTSLSLAISSAYLAAFLATSLALVAWQRRPSAWARPFAVMMMALSSWSLALALELSAQTATSVRLWRMGQILGASIMPVAWFVFAARYAGSERRLSPLRRWALYLVPLITVFLAITNTWHGLVWRAWRDPTGDLPGGVMPGVWLSIQAVYACILTLGGVVILWRVLWQMHREQRWRRMIIILGAILPVTGFVLQVLEIDRAGETTLLPVLLTAGVVCLSWTAARQQILDLVPIARQTVLRSMPDGVIVMNNQDRLVEINPAAEQIIGRNAEAIIGERFVEVVPEWRSLWYESVIRGEYQTEVSVDVGGERRWFDMRLTPVYARDRHLSGRLMTLRDITDQKRTEKELIERRKFVEDLVAVARATAEGPGLQATLQNALDITTSLTGAEYGSLFLLDGTGRVTHSILARGNTPPGSRRKIVGTVMDDGLAGWVVRNRETALIDDTLDDERWVTFPDQPYVARSVLVVPITSGEDVPGVLTLQHAEPGFFDEDDAALLRAASDQMALALHKAQLYDEQIRLANRQQTLFEVLKTVGRHLDPATVVHVATETIVGRTGWSGAAILVPAPDGAFLNVRAGAGLLASFQGRRLSAARSPFARALATAQTQTRGSLETVPGDDETLPLLESAMMVPFRYAQDQTGLLVVGSDETGSFEEDDILLAESLAEVIGMTMTNAQLFQVVADEHSRLQALIESSRDGIVLVGNKGHILFLNNMALDILGIENEPVDWLYRPLTDLLASLGEEAQDLLSLVEIEAIHGDRVESAMGEGELAINDRALRWQNLPVRTEKMLVGRLIVLEDVSREQALQRMREDLTHTMVHDLRNPLNIVSGSLEMLESGLRTDMAPGELGKILDISRQSIGRMLHLVNGILTISRLESEQVPLNLQELDLGDLMQQVLAAQEALAREKEIQLGGLNGCAFSEQTLVQADEELIERVLQNLIGNAIKFTPVGGNIVVHMARADAGGLLVSVRDTGPGIPPDIRDQLFEKFVTGLQKEKGAGLGLAFCRMAIEAHGGQIWAENNADGGATFYFTLPGPTA